MKGTDTHDNENEPLTFVRLAAVTANAIQFLFEQQSINDQHPKADRDGHEREGNSENEVREGRGREVLLGLTGDKKPGTEIPGVWPAGRKGVAG